MLDLTPYGRLAQLSTLTDRMIRDASKEAVVAAARMLAIHLGLYQRRFGAIPLDEAIDLLQTRGLTEEQAGQVADGLEILAMAFASVEDDEPAPPVQ